MKIVLDTNVLVAGLLSPQGPCSKVLQLILSERVQLCHDERILAEYRDVLARPRFGFHADLVAAVIDFLEQSGESIISPPWPLALPDPDDAMFLEVAAAADAMCLITGNLRHFPARVRGSVRVLSPAEFLKIRI
ncbi:MAG: putative toxin-antitoxin system toxin component, PIN family [Planctomycetaceae bacterium]|nr:putative toxin-antitoxin system toxin component, PIN family [Planctomycetaceae bacterium]